MLLPELDADDPLALLLPEAELADDPLAPPDARLNGSNDDAPETDESDTSIDDSCETSKSPSLYRNRATAQEASKWARSHRTKDKITNMRGRVAPNISQAALPRLSPIFSA